MRLDHLLSMEKSEPEGARNPRSASGGSRLNDGGSGLEALFNFEGPQKGRTG